MIVSSALPWISDQEGKHFPSQHQASRNADLAVLYRHNVPLWPSSRQGNYQNLSSVDDLPSQDTPQPTTGMSAAHKSLLTPRFTPSPNTPGFQDSVGNTPAIEQLKYDQEEAPKKSWFGYGWRGGARIAFISTVVTLIINVTLLVFNVLHYPKMSGFPVVYRGTCSEAELRNTIWHLVINILSTSMLAASNYCMQLLCAPNRSNVDRAHAQGVWLDIGVQSLRNLRFVTWKRRALWMALCISSIPLHLVYNSTFYAAIGSNNYNVLYATPDFLNGSDYDTSRFVSTPSMNISGFQANASRWERFSNRDCIQTYAFDFMTNYKNVIAVVSNTSDYGSLLDVYVNDMPSAQEFNSHYDSFSWICNDTIMHYDYNSSGTLCREESKNIQKTANTRWNSAGYEISYCLAEKVLVPDCHLHFAPQLMGPVVLMNIVKCIVTFYVAFRLRDAPLVTLGDAIESFLKHPDPCTRGMCLATAQEMAHQFSRATHHAPILRAKTFDATRYRWHKIITKRQWLLLSALFTMVFAGLIIGLVVGTANLNPANIRNALAIPIGTVEAQNLVLGARIGSLGASAVLITALIANSPQALLSFLYMVYNSIFTLMYIGEDWDMYGAYTATTRHKLQIAAKKQTHRFLRVSNPRGTQKPTHFLNLPYRYAIPLICISGLLHWFMSQTLYLANISVVNRDDTIPNTDEITTVAYAPIGMIGLLVLSGVMVIVLVSNSLRYFGGQMPIVGSNSAAISAACHVQMSERRRRELVLRKIAWGEVPTDGSNIPITAAERRATVMSVSKGLGINDGGFKSNSIYSADDFSDVIDRDEEYGVDGRGGGNEYSALRGHVEMSDLDGRGAGRSTAVAHCTFSDTFVFKPEVGKFYA